MYFSRSTYFVKSFKKLSKKDKIWFVERMNLFENDEYNPILKNHKLHGEYREYRSININGDIRVIYKKMSEFTYLLYGIGTHSELYS